jgi:hypothetical protein
MTIRYSLMEFGVVRFNEMLHWTGGITWKTLSPTLKVHKIRGAMLRGFFCVVTQGESQFLPASVTQQLHYPADFLAGNHQALQKAARSGTAKASD